MRSIREEWLDRMIFFGEPALRPGLREFVAHYHEERSHQGIDNRLIEPAPPSSRGAIECRERLAVEPSLPLDTDRHSVGAARRERDSNDESHIHILPPERD